MPTSQEDTEELLRRVMVGDHGARRVLLERYRTRLEKMISARIDPRVRSRFDPSDVVQETLAAASEKMDAYLCDNPLPFYPWLRQIAWEKLVHEHDRHLRAAKRTVTRERAFSPGISDASVAGIAEHFVGTFTSPSGQLKRQELQQRVRSALAALAEADCEVLLMRYVEQMPSKEIAAVLGVSEAAVNMRHMRALERMRTILTRNQGES